MNTRFNWFDKSSIPQKLITHADWNRLVRTLDPTPEDQLTVDNDGYECYGHHLLDDTDYTCDYKWTDGSWLIRKDTRNKTIHWLLVQDNDGNRTAYYTNDDDEKNDTSHCFGYQASKRVCEIFESINGISMIDAFGLLKKDEKHGELFSNAFKFVNPFIFCDPLFMDFMPFDNGYKADISSAYPASACGPMPDVRTIIAVECDTIPYDKVEEGYRFGLSSSGDVIIDGNSLLEHMIANIPRDPDSAVANYVYDRVDRVKANYAAEDKHVWLLMKPSKYTLDSTFRTLYHTKESAPKDSEEYKEAKGTLNSSIGFWRSIKSSTHNEKMYFPFLSMFTYDRYCFKMIDIIANVLDNGGSIVQVLTDSILAKDSLGTIATDEKGLGSFTYEHKNQRFVSFKSGQYAIETDGEESDVVFKHQGFSLSEEQEKDIVSLLDVIDFMDDKNLLCGDIMTVLDMKTGYWTEVLVRMED